MLALSETGKQFESPAEEIVVRGVKIKIKDVEKHLKQQDGDAAIKDNKFKMTQLEVGVQGDKQLIVPSFGMTSALFARHFEILR